MNTVLYLSNKFLLSNIRKRHKWVKISRLARRSDDIVAVAGITKNGLLQKRRDSGFIGTTDAGRVMETASVADFYAGKSVFVTGVTGYLGKVFLEKLLYSCKDIDKVYVLIRDKKGKNYKQRIEEVMDKPLFSRLKEERPHVFNKVIPIAGDIGHPELGISTKDEEMLVQKVSVVFHVAATIKFNEELKVAVNLNVTGTKYVLRLCQRMKNIKAFIHVSTAFCNTDKQILEEKVYPPPADLSEVQKFLEQSNYDGEHVKAFLKDLPNTYTFTKALAETYVAENHGNIPTVIIRPSIVSASLREPIAGWVDSWLGATGILTAIMKGGIRVLLGNGDNVLDLIPVDYVINLTIAAAARCNSSDVAVYNSCTSSCNPLTLGNVFTYLKRPESRKGFGGSRMSLTFTNSICTLSILTFLLQTLPAFIADLFLRATGKPPIHMKMQAKAVAGRASLEFFTNNSWEMKADHTRALHASLSAEDRRQFPCDPSDIKWDDYIAVYMNGIKRFLLTNDV